MEKVGQILLGLVQSPHDSDELEDVGVGGVDQPIEEKVQHLGDDEVRVRVDVLFGAFAFVFQFHLQRKLVEHEESAGGIPFKVIKLIHADDWSILKHGHEDINQSKS